MNGYEFDKNFWRKNAKVVEIDACEIIDRLFYCSLTCQLPFQEAFTLTALDKRPFAPPVESTWTKVVNMANTCETFKISPGTVSDLHAKGFRSLTLLSFADTNMPIKYHWERNCFIRCVNILNDRKSQPLEPLHSLRRLLQHKRRGVQKVVENKAKIEDDKKMSTVKELNWLDLAVVVCASEPEIPIKMEYKQPASMIARSTFDFKSRDTKKLFGPPLQECRCKKKYRYYETSEQTNPEDLKSPTLSSSSSGYSSASSNLYSPDYLLADEKVSYFQLSPSCRNYTSEAARPSPTRTFYSTHRNTYKHQPYRQYENRPETNYKRNNQNTGYNNKAQFNEKVDCPFLDCNEKIPLSQVDSHCIEIHKIVSAKVVDKNGRDYRIKFTLSAKDVLSENMNSIWWGPKHFMFDKVTFYQIVYKKYDEITKEIKILFWIWANLPKEESNKYFYEIHLESARTPDPNYPIRHYQGTVQSLEISASKMIENKMHKLVYFPLSYVRKHLQIQKHHFTNYHNTTTPHLPADIKYAVKIMRPS